MNIDEWIGEVEKACKAFGKTLTAPDKEMLLRDTIEKPSTFDDTDRLVAESVAAEMQRELIYEISELFIRYVFRKASDSETFGDLNRVEERFGTSIEKAYGIDSGPYLNLAKVYWTFKIELRDLLIEEKTNYRKKVIVQVLNRVEQEVGWSFFPLAGPLTVPAAIRRKEQKEFLEKYAPDVNIEDIIEGFFKSRSNPENRDAREITIWPGFIWAFIILTVAVLVPQGSWWGKVVHWVAVFCFVIVVFVIYELFKERRKRSNFPKIKSRRENYHGIE